MIRLQNVSKFYYSKGVIATGFSRVNLKFSLGEFVAITGESGSGKSTLINVISGLDSYEEGELYVNGHETSHYLEKDWENYRRKYIGNIYQNFNLINSYTVYQNVDLILSLNGISRGKRKRRIISLLKRVDMLKYKNTKVSKLSGGQKQRVAIARALAKDVPIIIADEPTGSLDKESAQNIIKLLKEIAKDKLVIIVTHNYEQVEEFVTRKITMHDGKIIEDFKIKNEIVENTRDFTTYRNMGDFDKLTLGFRNTFNIFTKFILLLLVYSFVVSALMVEYSYFKKGEYEASKEGVNFIFKDLNDHRVIVNKNDKSSFSLEELSALNNLDNVDYLIENDTLIDQMVDFTDANEEMWFSGTIRNINSIKNVDYGRLPNNDNEIVIQGLEDDYNLVDDKEALLDNDFYFQNSYTGETNRSNKYKIVGIKYFDNQSMFNISEYYFYVSNQTLKDIQFLTHQANSTVTINFMGTNHVSGGYGNDFKLEANNWVTPGTAIVSEDYNMYCSKYMCRNKKFSVTVNNIYYSDTLEFNIEKLYNMNNFNSILEVNGYNKKNFDELYNGTIYINPIDYNKLFNKGTYQISIYVKDINKLNDTVKVLNDNGYHTLKMKDTIVPVEMVQILRIFKLIVTILLVVVLFFISYFIIKIILKSRNTYFSILRMLGASKLVCTELLIIELFIVCNISYFIFLLMAEANRLKYISVGFIDTINTYFKYNDYIVLYVILIIMSFLISVRFARKLFKTSVMTAYREGE